MANPEALKFSDAEDVRTKDREHLLSDLRNMVNNPDASDVIFRCNDGIPVHACRPLLANRCAVFNRMLSNGMLETRLSEIPLVNFSSPVIISVMEYLYTSTMDTHPPINWRMGFEMISAAQFFDIPRVEVIARDFLRSQVASLNDKPKSQTSALMDMLSAAVEFQETWPGKDAMLQGLIEHIGENWFEEDASHKLSIEAVDFILSSAKQGCIQAEGELSVEEYFTFRKIVLWHIYREVDVRNGAAKRTVEKLLPGRSASSTWRRFLETPVDIKGYVFDILLSTESRELTTVKLNFLVGTDISKDSLETLLRHVNLHIIPAQLLIKVIHPLAIFPREQLLEALVHQAIQRQCSQDGFGWMHGASITCSSNDGHVCFNSQADEARGVAIAFVEPATSSHVHEWSFEILEDDGHYIELGFICQPHGTVFRETPMLEKNLWTMSSTRVLCVNRKDENTCLSRKDPQKFWEGWECFKTEVKVDSVVNFKLNSLERICRVRFGNAFEAFWEELPEDELKSNGVQHGPNWGQGQSKVHTESPTRVAVGPGADKNKMRSWGTWRRELRLEGLQATGAELVADETEDESDQKSCDLNLEVLGGVDIDDSGQGSRSQPILEVPFSCL